MPHGHLKLTLFLRYSQACGSEKQNVKDHCQIIVLEKTSVTWWHVECFEREDQTSGYYNLNTGGITVCLKANLMKKITSEDDCPLQQMTSGEERWILCLLMPFWKMYFSQTLDKLKWNTNYYTQHVGRQITPELAINESCQRRKRNKGCFSLFRVVKSSKPEHH